MKTLVTVLTLLVSVAAPAADQWKIIKDTSNAEVSGFTETLYGKPAKTCFSGSPNQVCSQVKNLVSRANKDLTEAGASQRFNIVTCAQNPTRAMVIFSVQKTKKTVFIEQCGGGGDQQIALDLSNR